MPGYKPDPPIPLTPSGAERPPAYDDFDFGRMFVLGKDRVDVPAPLERMVENVLDWEHLPFVHPENFCSSRLLGHGTGWYRALVGSPPASSGAFNQVLVVVHPSLLRWFLTLETGHNAGIVIHADAVEVHDDRIVVELTFFQPQAPRNEVQRRALLDVYRRKLRLLYDQDIAMVVLRQDALDRLAARFSDARLGEPLGTLAELVPLAPFQITVRGQRFWVHRREGALEVVAAECPHMRLPLPCPSATVSGEGEDTVVCPWHGYRFDLRTGRADGDHTLRLARSPRLVVEGEVVVLQQR